MAEPLLPGNGSSRHLFSTLEPINEVDAEEDTRSKRQRLCHECDVCGTTYSEKRTLLRHLRTPAHCVKAGTPVPNYACDFCEERFGRNDIRQRHENEKHHGIRRRSTVPSRPNPLRSDPMTKEEPEPPSSSSAVTVDTCSASARENEGQIEHEPGPRLQNCQPDTAKGRHIEIEQQYPLWYDPNAGVDQQQMIQPSVADSMEVVPDTLNLNLHRDDDSILKHAIPEDSPHSLNAATLGEPPDAAPDSFTERGGSDHAQHNDDTASMQSVQTFGSFSRSIELPLCLLRSASSLIRHGASPRPRLTKPPPPCPLCGSSFVQGAAHLSSHLRRHLEELQGEHNCDACDVGFVHQADLIRHRQCAAAGHCGFDFEHLYECTGHHPAGEFDGLLSDRDRFQLCYRLRDWEQTQLRAYFVRVEDCIASQALTTDPDCWSMGDMICRSFGSMTSLVSRKEWSSAPDYVDYQARIDYGKVRDTARMRVFGTPLCTAAAIGNVEAVLSLLAQGADVNAKGKPSFGTAVCWAVRYGHIKVVEVLIEHGAHLKAADETCICPLAAAAARGRPNVTETLLSYCADIEEKDAKGATPICHAAREAHMDVVEILLAHGADPSVSPHLRAG